MTEKSKVVSINRGNNASEGDEEPPVCKIADEIRATAEEAIRAGAITFVALYETPNGDMHTPSIPDSFNLFLGFVKRCVWHIQDAENSVE
ncbi:MAG: hypothetical protein KGI54_14345, partial [Pseudomonadota bacterium]|nr:hypothetical protein [Pseudomonadota bacterium]